ncbi:uncharacterized protein METZ01_LOCUS461570, partial [marine metagenome]
MFNFVRAYSFGIGFATSFLSFPFGADIKCPPGQVPKDIHS